MTDIKKAEPGCTWVKPGWALQPTDFIRDDKGRMTAGESGIAWTITQRDHLCSDRTTMSLTYSIL